MNIKPEWFEGAAEKIERDGWRQGVAYDSSHCMMSAVGLTQEETGDKGLTSIGAAADFAERVIRDQGYFILGGIWNAAANWNDMPERTADEVIDMLKLCAKEAHDNVA